MMNRSLPIHALASILPAFSLPLQAVRVEAATPGAVLVEQRRMREAARRLLDTSARYFQEPLIQEAAHERR